MSWRPAGLHCQARDASCCATRACGQPISEGHMASGDGQGNGSSDATSRGVQSVEVGGRILVAMVQAGRPLMLRDLAGGADVTPAQAHAYLVSFRKLGLVEQDTATGRYQLGPFALQLGLARMRISNPLRLAGDAAAALAAE